MDFKLDHVAVAIRDLGAAKKQWEERLGLRCDKVESVPTEGAEVAFFDIGGPHLELVAPTDPSSSVAKSIDKRGEGLHHICLEVPDLEAALRLASMAGLELIDRTPRPGARGTKVAFIHPRALGGVLVELVQKPGSGAQGVPFLR